MSTPLEIALLELWHQNICPNCGKTIPDRSRVGSGRKSEGGFCSLDCYTTFNELALLERARRVQQAAKREES